MERGSVVGLLWSKVAADAAGEAEAHMTSQDLLAHPAAGMLTRAAQGGRMSRSLALGPGLAHVGPLADSIRQHGYQPHMHGSLHIEQRSDGFSRYHASGHEAEGHPLHGLKSDAAGNALVMALHDSGHPGAVPVHSFQTDAPNRPPVVHHEPEPEPHDEGPALYHGTFNEMEGQLHPNHGTSGNFGAATHAQGYAYATPHLDTAWNYATQMADHHGRLPRVYQVHPTGPTEDDPRYDEHGRSRGNYAGDLRSQHPFDIGEEQEPPTHIREQYHDNHEFEGSDYHPSRRSY